MPSKSCGFGRILDIQANSIELWHKDKISALRLSPKDQISTLSNKAVHPFDVLAVGDLVSVDSSQIWTLLAPCRENLLNKAFMTPAHINEKAKYSQKWIDFLESVRKFFKDSGFLEVNTNSLVACPGTEPTLEVFKTQIRQGTKIKPIYLRTSPEIQLKKLLAQGAEDLFEIALCFRNDENSELHLNEFYMLEWYRSYSNLQSIKKDVEELFLYLNKRLEISDPLFFESLAIDELFEKHTGFRITPETSLSEYQNLCEKHHLMTSSNFTIDDYFFLLWISLIEPHLPQEKVIFVYNYPRFQAALSRLTADGWADRFEVYWRGMELANAFHELNDPQEQLLRSQTDLKKKIILKKESIDLDPDFYEHLKHGMPPCGGIALGLERLFMAFYKLKNIHTLKL